MNPAGALIDLDRGVDKANWTRWSSQAEVATHIDDDHWIVEIGIPVTQDENDPYHRVIGNQPTVDLPWHINLCRQRVRDAKRLVADIAGRDINGALVEETCERIARIRVSEEGQEGLGAFLNKRKPDWLGN